jgi:DNA polymerase-3 subunit delta
MDYAGFKKSVQSGDISPVYLFIVEEPYLLRAAIKDLLGKLGPSPSEVDYEPLFADETSYQEIIQKAADFPLFGGKRLILVREIRKLTAVPPPLVEDYLKRPATSTILVFSLARETGKKRNKTYAHPLIRLIAKHQTVVELTRVKPAEAERFAGNYLKERGWQAEPAAISFLVELVGCDLYAIAGELEKTMLYLGEEKRLTLKEAKLIFGRRYKHQLWELADAVGRKEAGRALILLSRLMEKGLPPEVILAAIEGHIAELTKLLSASISGKGLSELKSLIPNERRRFLVAEYLKQARNFDLDKLERAIARFSRFDFYLKRSVFKKKEEVLLAALILEVASGDKISPFSPLIY